MRKLIEYHFSVDRCISPGEYETSWYIRRTLFFLFIPIKMQLIKRDPNQAIQVCCFGDEFDYSAYWHPKLQGVPNKIKYY